MVKRPYKTPELTFRTEVEEMLRSARVVGEPSASPFRFADGASAVARKAVALLANGPEPTKMLWLALFALDSELDDKDPRGSLVLLKDIGAFTGKLRKRGDAARKRLPARWQALVKKLENLEREVSELGATTRMLLIERDTDREHMMTDLHDALSQFAAWVRELQPLRGRGAPRRADNDYSWRRAGMVFFFLHREGMTATELRKLIEHSSTDWLPVPPIRVVVLRRMMRSGRRLRDRITTLIREGKRELS